MVKLVKDDFNCYSLLCGKMRWNKRLFTHPWPTMYIYFYAIQQNIVLTSRKLRNKKNK
jgi:hypothetical protein